MASGSDSAGVTAKSKTADFPKPMLVIDTREQTPLVFHNLPSVTGTLQSGDYSIRGAEELFAIERKSVADIVGCCCGDSRERFERELHRLRGFRFKRLLVVGCRAEVEQHRYQSRVEPKVVLHSLNAWECRYDIPVAWQPDAVAAALQVEQWAFWFHRELLKNAKRLEC